MIVNIERKVIKVEETLPILLGDRSMTTIRMKLICNPNVDDNIKCNSEEEFIDIIKND